MFLILNSQIDFIKNEIILFENKNVKSGVNMQDVIVWLSMKHMANLFVRDKYVISRQIKNVLKEL